jgi:hypothetical protein
MKRTNDNPYASHENVSMLLPWYVNKTLHGAELNAVEQHLKVCLICKREIVNLQHLATAVNQPGTFDSAAQASFSRFKKRLQSAETEQLQIAPVVAFAKLDKQQSKVIGKHLNLSKPALALAATVLLAVLLPRFINIEQVFSNDYRTLSDAETVKTNKNELRVIFKDNTSRQTIDQILTSVQAHAIDGPNAQSLYTIGFDKLVEASQLIDKLAVLRKNEHVVFAEPAYALLSNSQPEQAKP